MKKIFITLCAAASLAACATDADTNVGSLNSNNVTISPSITRATDTSFEDNDQIGLSMTKASGEVYLTNQKMTYSGGVFSASDVLWYTGSSETSTLVAYYPYSTSGVPTEFTVQSDQSAGYSSSDLMFSVVNNVEPTADAVDMVFDHKLSNLVISTVSSDYTVESIKIVDINSTATVDVAKETVAVKTGTEDDITTLKSGEKFYAVVVPQTGVINFEITVAGIDEPVLASTKTSTLESGKQHSLTLYVVVSTSGDVDADVSVDGDIYDWTGGADLDQDILSVAFDKDYSGEYALVDGTLTIDFSVSGTDANKDDVMWGTSDATVASVANGVVTFKTWGEVSIAAKYGATQISAELTIIPTGTVKIETPATTEFSLDGDNAATSTTLTAVITDGDALQEHLTWTSSDEKVATVEDGVVTFVSAGDVTITVSLLDDSSDSVTLTLTKNLSADATIAWDGSFDGNYMLSKGSVTLAVSLSDASADDVSWSSSNEDVATVDASGKVTFVTYGDATITAALDADRSVSTDIAIPGGWWAESYDTYTGAFTVNSSNTTNDYYLFGSNSNTNVGSDGYLSITTTNQQSSWSKEITVDDVAHTGDYILNEAWRSDFWCLNEPNATINANVYPYLAIHLDNNVIKNNVIYQEFDINITYAGAVDTTSKRSVNNTNGYSSTAITTHVIYLDDDSLILVYDLSSFAKSYILGDLTSDADSYHVFDSLSINHYMYGYESDTTIDDVTYKALSAFTFNLYSVQTFASLDDIATYIADKGLTEVTE